MKAISTKYAPIAQSFILAAVPVEYNYTIFKNFWVEIEKDSFTFRDFYGSHNCINASLTCSNVSSEIIFCHFYSAYILHYPYWKYPCYLAVLFWAIGPKLLFSFLVLRTSVLDYAPSEKTHKSPKSHVIFLVHTCHTVRLIIEKNATVFSILFLFIRRVELELEALPSSAMKR